jgi:murein DD-endopeptidase MepM/ murein hydrolase activator NlpD
LRVLRGRIDRSLEAAVVAAGGTPTLAANLADLFAWDIDVNVDPRRGDAFAIALTRVRLPDGSWREGAIQAAEYRGAAGRFRAYRFRDGARPAYFDERARPLKRRYLASPLPFVRITSKFGRRWHPILARPSHHGGIDYAAPRGTPAWAVADGRVEFAGHNGGYGKLVILRHPDGMRSYYAHLSRIAKVMRRGARVGQKQVVGYVGTTGLSTGPHLHFAMRQGGRFVDPAKARGRRAAPLPPAKARDFRRLVAQLDTRMRGTEVAAR